MTENPLRQLESHGQSAWLDQVRRDWFESRLQAWIDEDDVRGVTSNPSIFQAAISQSDCYDDQIRELAAQGLAADAIYDRVTLDDIVSACDVFRQVYDSTMGLDGYVSHEVSPRLAYDTLATLREAERLWKAVDRPNLMIKIPATKEGLPAIRQALAKGININVTLMFSMAHYEAVADAYLYGLEDRLAAGGSINSVASVASFFVSRVDSKVDKILDSRLATEAPQGTTSAKRLLALKGKAAVANSKRAYRRYEEIFTSDRFAVLERRGARPQRVLWASTSTKNPAYSDVLYVDELIGPNTVNTLPLKTLEAFRDHGRVAATLTAGLDEADRVVSELGSLGIDLRALGEQLSEEGVQAFINSLDGVLEAIEQKRATIA
jgi:transaldolase